MSNEPGNGVIGPAVLTHGTLEARAKESARTIYEQILGLRCVNTSKVSQLVAGGGNVAVVCVQAGSTVHPQGEENRWIVLVDSDSSVADVHAVADKSEGIAILRPIETNDGISSFIMQDIDGNWWEITNRSVGHYQDIFEHGDVVAA